MLDAQLRPCLHGSEILFDLLDLAEAGVEQVILTGKDLAGRELHDVDDPEVNASYFGRVVVNQADDSIGTSASDLHLLGQLALHPDAIPIVPLRVFHGDVSADAD